MMTIGVGDIVVLSNRQRGIVVDLNGNDPLRPVVRLFQSGISGSQFSPELDLAKHGEIGITSIVSAASVSPGRAGGSPVNSLSPESACAR